MDKIAIIGGGAAGMMASIFAARRGAEVHVYEKNEKTGKKLYITGKGRCNLTNACDMEELLESVKSNKKFLYSAFYGFTNENAMDFFEKEGLKLKVERGNRVFPLSERICGCTGYFEKIHETGRSPGTSEYRSKKSA